MMEFVTLGLASGRRNSSKLTPLDFEAQIFRVLLCTARLLVSSPGGLRFKADSRPWLAHLSSGRLSY
jgi:hypothetical protein